ncbi:PqqD family protein [Pedobacter cryoconitis]|uniref:Coenzyme PQQ synthesis protein D (PqqD) n=1 Tax=Pedobacter cryoconitis TaxID=188932 RepID=A0A7X0J1P3_9SPHI|nr:PqqD family protein [Pedobacter cryoconitis]MBB6499305.1 hypothetical protein [Pedobacter cryoconitis]
MNLPKRNIRIADHSIVQEMGHGVVILNLNTEHFYELDEVGKRFWELLSDHQDSESVFNVLQDEYEVSAEQLQTDILRLIENLEKAELIVVS